MKKLLGALLMTAALAAALLVSCAKQKQTTLQGADNMQKSESVQAADIADYAEKSMFAVGKPNDGFAQYFSGKSYLEILNTSGAFVANVTFEPGCRNNWHIHHSEAQILVGVGGRGWVQIEGEEAKPINAGDVVCIEPGVKHWHGAAADSWFSHLSISAPKTDGTGKTGTDWLEAVESKDYDKLR